MFCDCWSWLKINCSGKGNQSIHMYCGRLRFLQTVGHKKLNWILWMCTAKQPFLFSKMVADVVNSSLLLSLETESSFGLGSIGLLVLGWMGHKWVDLTQAVVRYDWSDMVRVKIIYLMKGNLFKTFFMYFMGFLPKIKL